MGIWNRLLGREAEQKSVTFDPVWLNWFGSRTSKGRCSGVRWERALDVSTGVRLHQGDSKWRRPGAVCRS